MSKYIYQIPITDEIKLEFKKKFNLEEINNTHFAWGFDISCKYFMQIWTELNNEKIYIEDGFVGGSRYYIFSKMKEYRLFDYIKKLNVDHFTNVLLDLPF